MDDKKQLFFWFTAAIPDGQVVTLEEETLIMQTAGFFLTNFHISFFFPREFCNGQTGHLVSLLSGPAAVFPPLFHTNEEAEMKGHDIWKAPGSTFCSAAKQGPDGFKRRNGVGAISNAIIYPRSNRAALGDTSHDT